ncbi:PEP-CTERM sorting domain-containing protein [Chitinivorax sp. B]|uniref:PEP-CTERM sorting domain-containing protein n=1 Tax=Chitinivorax sp. B TaxID=2502235 RepID=UPI0010F676DC|nr:PEP-CTERM sorting domain-containing protein [Chitinivorax sp. B]
MLRKILLIVGMALSSASNAGLLLQDGFDVDSTQTILNFDGYTNWTVSNGSTDYYFNDSLTCAYGSAGGCVDLDGTTGQAGRMTSRKSYTFQAGYTYSLFGDIGGSQRSNGGNDTVTFGILQGGLPSYTRVVSDLAWNADWSTYELSFVPTTNFTGQLFFQNDGGDNIGALLDNVMFLTTAPEPGGTTPLPGTLAILGLGLTALGLIRARS